MSKKLCNGQKKVVLDSNIFISALGWQGKPEQIFKKCIKNEIILITSKEQISELNRVLEYPKFNFTDIEKNKFISIIMNISRFVDIPKKLNIIKDDLSDNIILETAVVGGADYLITGDPHLLKLKEFQRIKIITASHFLEIF